MRRHKGDNGLAVFIELNAICAIVEVKHRIQRVVIHRFSRQAFCGCRSKFGLLLYERFRYRCVHEVQNGTATARRISAIHLRRGHTPSPKLRLPEAITPRSNARLLLVV